MVNIILIVKRFSSFYLRVVDINLGWRARRLEVGDEILPLGRLLDSSKDHFGSL
jgi:hypothetical protein